MITEADCLYALRAEDVQLTDIYCWTYEKYLVNGNLKVLRRKGNRKVCFTALSEGHERRPERLAPVTLKRNLTLINARFRKVLNSRST